ncbi:hypothetical protein CIT292_08691 [Citrobacter youngae ATCC 29220]|uniref:Uncharacterized protein n=1 Tax=Citrobacter youngae ATCC 29220 TaxID=500640 RepID=D4BDX2_9ENTR|nr:hypothetical protein CIT292_08691 [Citrobacter youngae ATCC 29220]
MMFTEQDNDKKYECNIHSWIIYRLGVIAMNVDISMHGYIDL